MLITKGKPISLIVWPASMLCLIWGGSGYSPAYWIGVGSLFLLPLCKDMGLRNLPSWKRSLDFFCLVFIATSPTVSFILTLPLSAFTLPSEAPLFVALSWKAQNQTLFAFTLILVGMLNAACMWWILGEVRAPLSEEELKRKKSVEQSLAKRNKLINQVKGRGATECEKPYM